MVTFIGGSKGRTDMMVSIEKQRISDRKQMQARQAPERLSSEYDKRPVSGQPANRANLFVRLWHRLRG